MNVTVHIKPGYRGECARCMNAPAIHKVWYEFKHPLPARPEFGIEMAKGVWQYVCVECLKPNDKIGQD